ncbi:unknown [Prevotella sp. CAG:487]|nr:unknown [Prevotella sp. CAG:487]
MHIITSTNSASSRLTNNKRSNIRHIIASTNSASLRLPCSKLINDSHIITSIDCASLLVRRKILRLYSGLQRMT